MISCFNPWSLKDPDSARPQPEIQIRTDHIKTKHTERAKDILLYPWSLKTQIQPDSRNPDADWPNKPQSLTHSNIQTQTNRNNSRSSSTPAQPGKYQEQHQSTTRKAPGAQNQTNKPRSQTHSRLTDIRHRPTARASPVAPPDTTRPTRRSNTVRTTADFNKDVFLIILAAQATDFKKSGRFGKPKLWRI